MRRKDREISDIKEILEIVKKCDVCRVAFHAGKYPYIIPMNFGIVQREGTIKLYFHGAKAGTKLELIKENADVAFEMDCSHNVILGEIACDSTMEYESVCGNGIMRIVSEDEKAAALSALMQQYQSDKNHDFSDKDMKAVEVFELTVDEIHGKRQKK